MIGYSRDPDAVGDVVAVRRNPATGHLAVALAATSPPAPIPPTSREQPQSPHIATNAADAAVAAAEAAARTGATVSALLAARDAVPRELGQHDATWSRSEATASPGALGEPRLRCEPDRDGQLVLVTAVLGAAQNRSGLSVSWIGDCCACCVDEHGLELLTDHPPSRPGDPPAPIPALQHATVDTLGHALLRTRPWRILLTSPGVHHRLGPDQMARIARSASSAQDAAQRLTGTAHRGSRGATAVVLEAR